MGPRAAGVGTGDWGCGRWCVVRWISLTVVGRSVATLLHWNLRLILRVLDEPRREVGEHCPATLITLLSELFSALGLGHRHSRRSPKALPYPVRWLLAVNGLGPTSAQGDFDGRTGGRRLPQRRRGLVRSPHGRRADAQYEVSCLKKGRLL